MISTAFREQAAVFERAVANTSDPVGSLDRVYRKFALAHPHLYRLMTERPLKRELLERGVEALAAAPVIRAAGGDPDRARALWAFAHRHDHPRTR